ncbi:hypothetical protein AB4Z52_34350 [Rhizobium sp. 2YAF20]|uniref:hypothetical protein n=1 Tax=Rhizobium sp. 2YAF20 TaxID=3233027 RepID=UPI003F9CCB01
MIWTSDNLQLQANFNVTSDSGLYRLVFKAGGGNSNPDYADGLQLIFERLATKDAVLVSLAVDSATAQANPDKKSSFNPRGYECPIPLARVADLIDLRVAVTEAQKAILSTASKGGSPRKTILMRLLIPNDPWTNETLEAYLRYGEDEDRPQIELLTAKDKPEQYFQQWIKDLRGNGAAFQNEIYVFPEYGLKMQTRPSTETTLARVAFGEGVQPADWTVEFNLPLTAPNDNVTTAVGKDQKGRQWLLKQGRLQRKSDQEPEVSPEQFAYISALPPARVLDTRRDWYTVACLSAPPSQIYQRTMEFVKLCAFVRRSTGSAKITRPETRDGRPENGDNYFLPFIQRDPREVRRKQGLVWLALARRLSDHGIDLRKLGRAAYEVDAIVDVPSQSFLIEIKTTVQAADIYAGVGQLFLYRKIIPEIERHTPILLLPEGAGSIILDALKELPIAVHSYVLDDGINNAVTFSGAFINALIAPPHR